MHKQMDPRAPETPSLVPQPLPLGSTHPSHLPTKSQPQKAVFARRGPGAPITLALVFL